MNDQNNQWMSVSVESFLETGGEALEMELIAGASGLKRRIPEAAVNRPGLALTGFFEYFAHKRIQVIGYAEHAYLSSLDSETRKKKFKDCIDYKIPCFVVSRKKKVFKELIDLAEEYNVPVLRTRMITWHFINAATIMMENMMAPRMKIQGTMVEIMGIGVLIEGKPGLGKSETALGLIRKGAALVSDDITAIRLDSSGALIASPINVTRYHMEVRGVGIVHVPSLFGVASVREEKKLDLVISLKDVDDGDDSEAVGEAERYTNILGVEIPNVILKVAPGRNISNVVETAALNQKLRRLGHDAAKELDEKLMALISRGRDGSE